MKFKSKILAFTLLAQCASLTAMQQPTMEPIEQAVNQASARTRGWFESWLPSTVENAERGTQAFQTISEKGLTVNHDLKGLSTDGVKMFADPNTIQELNKTGVSLMKTYLVAGIGGALSLSGIILCFKTLMSAKADGAKDTRPLYKRILTNRYLISALLVASGVGIILKSDKIVAAVS